LEEKVSVLEKEKEAVNKVINEMKQSEEMNLQKIKKLKASKTYLQRKRFALEDLLENKSEELDDLV